MKKSILTKNQVKKYSKNIKINGKDKKINAKIRVEVRYDDRCGNGHNTFAITGAIYDHPTSTSDERCLAMGAIHEEIKRYMPELAHLIKWHSMNSNGPLHYIKNTIYWSRDRDHEDKEIGEAVEWTTRLKFEKYPFTFEESAKGFWDYIDNVKDFNDISVVAIEYTKADGDYKFSPKYSFEGFIKKDEPKQWYKAPFDTKREAEEFLKALLESRYKYIKVPTKWCKPLEPNLENARRSAIWEDATLEQLQNKKLLEARLPRLIEEFIEVVEELGFTY